MSLLAAVIPMLSEGSAFNFKLTRIKGEVCIITNPTLPDFKPDTTDAELAALQSALVMPLVIRIPVDDPAPDATLAALLAEAHTLRQPARDGLAAFQAAQQEAANSAKLAQTKKDEERKAKSGTKPAAGAAKPAPKPAPGVPLAALSGEDATPKNEGSDAESDSEANATSADAASDAPAAPAASIDLFA